VCLEDQESKLKLLRQELLSKAPSEGPEFKLLKSLRPELQLKAPLEDREFKFKLQQIMLLGDQE